MSSPLTALMFKELAALVNGPQSPSRLEGALRLLAKWRCTFIQARLIESSGTTVRSGVFKGMDFVERSAEGCHVPKLLGCYEEPLQPEIEAAIARGYARVLNIGSAEGYYAVGLARRKQGAHIVAFDISARAREATVALAAKNGVATRIEIGERFAHEDFARLADRGTLIVCDIEGAERELLDPDRAPALRAADIIVEAHDGMIPGLSSLIAGRFGPTHEARIIVDTGMRHVPDPPGWFAGLSHLDQLLAVWEWRSGPTPWLVLRAR